MRPPPGTVQTPSAAQLSCARAGAAASKAAAAKPMTPARLRAPAMDKYFMRELYKTSALPRRAQAPMD